MKTKKIKFSFKKGDLVKYDDGFGDILIGLIVKERYIYWIYVDRKIDKHILNKIEYIHEEWLSKMKKI